MFKKTKTNKQNPRDPVFLNDVTLRGGGGEEVILLMSSVNHTKFFFLTWEREGGSSHVVFYISVLGFPY
jgi:hypothetical protein